MSENPLIPFLQRYTNDPVLMVREVLAMEPDADQIAIMQAVARGDRRISIRSGHRVGKTTTLAWITVWHALTRFRQKTICTSATSTQLFEALASETKSCFKRLPQALQELFEIQVDQIRLKAAPEDSFVSYVVSKAETPEALAGKHSDHVLLICDEASGIPEPVFNAAVGSMAAHNACTILAGNPIRTSGLFFDTHNKTDVMEMWTRFHISSIGNPRITPDFYRQVEAQHGLDSNEYRVRVLGEFPTGDADTVIPFVLLESALRRDVTALQVRPIWGVDPARFGNDATGLCKRRGNSLVEPTDIRKGYDTMQVAGWIKSQWDETPDLDRPSEILCDVIGIGAGVQDRLAELGLPSRGINVSETAAMSEQYVNLRTELWFKGRDYFDRKDCTLNGDELLASELRGPRFKYASNGKKQVESKDDMKKRGVRSPNRADAFLLTLASENVSAAGGYARQSWNEPLHFRVKSLV